MIGIRPYIGYFHSSQYVNDLANGDIYVSIGYSGDVLQACDRAAEAGQGINLAYTIAREVAQVGFDMRAIPDDTPNPEKAMKFIDYIVQAKVAAYITNHVYSANPNTAATEFVGEGVTSDPGIYPPAEARAKLFLLKRHSARYGRTLTRAWTTVRTGK